jgi:DNA-binding CsgD family transcriptional regulator
VSDRESDPSDLRAFRVRFAGEELAVLSVRVEPITLSPSLTEAEREVCRLALDGCSNQEIAAHRRVAPRTVANQLASIFRKLGIASRTELAARLGSDRR